jgi:hypothetical protein
MGSELMITPEELLDTSIAQLQTLATFLGEQLGDRSDRAESATSEACACKEILLSLNLVIRKFQAAHHVRPGDQGIARREDCEVC